MTANTWLNIILQCILHDTESFCKLTELILKDEVGTIPVWLTISVHSFYHFSQTATCIHSGHSTVPMSLMYTIMNITETGRRLS